MARSYWSCAVPVLLAACGSGPVRRVSEPAASIQQLTVRADGNWSVDLRLNNYSSVPMRFDAVALALVVGSEAAGNVQGNPAHHRRPGIGGRHHAGAGALVGRAPAARRYAGRAAQLAYTLTGSVDAAPEDGDPRTYTIERSSALSPVPGLPGVLR